MQDETGNTEQSKDEDVQDVVNNATPAPQQTPDKGGQEQVATFTQEQLNAIVGERAKRAEQAAQNKILQEAGLQSIEDLIAAAKAQKEAQDAAKSNEEKLNEQIAALQSEHSALQTQYANALINQAILTEAEKEDYGLSKDVRPTLLKLIDLTEVKLNAEGVVEGVDAAIKAAIEAHPILKKEEVSNGKLPQGNKTTYTPKVPSKKDNLEKPKFRF